MKFIYATYNQYCNSIDITTFDNMILRIDCNKAEDGLKTTPNSQCALNTLAIDNPMEYSRLALDLSLIHIFLQSVSESLQIPFHHSLQGPFC